MLNPEVNAERQRQNRDRISWSLFLVQLAVLVSAIIYMRSSAVSNLDEIASKAYKLGAEIGIRTALKHCGRGV